MEKGFNCVNCGCKNFVHSLNFRKKFDFTNSKIKNDMTYLNVLYKELESKSNIYILPSKTIKNYSFILRSRSHYFYFQSIDNLSFRCSNCSYIYTDKLDNIIDKSKQDVSIRHNLFKNKKGF
jgi:hypothetical protein